LLKPFTVNLDFVFICLQVVGRRTPKCSQSRRGFTWQGGRIF